MKLVTKTMINKHISHWLASWIPMNSSNGGQPCRHCRITKNITLKELRFIKEDYVTCRNLTNSGITFWRNRGNSWSSSSCRERDQAGRMASWAYQPTTKQYWISTKPPCSTSTTRRKCGWIMQTLLAMTAVSLRKLKIFMIGHCRPCQSLSTARFGKRTRNGL